MSTDPLTLLAITAGLPEEAEYEAVYAAVTATERGRWFLTEYASRNRHADTELITAALERIEAAIKAVRANDGAQVAIGENGAANGAPQSVEAAPVAARASEVSGNAGASPSLSDPFELAWQDERNFAAAAIALQASLSSLGDNNESAPRELQSQFVDAVPAEPHSASRAPRADPTDRPRSYIEPPDFVFAPPARETDRDADVESAEPSVQAHPLLPGTELLPDPSDDPADLFEAMPQGAGVAGPSTPTTIPAAPAAAPPPTQLPPPQLRIAAGSAIRPSPRPAPSNPLAALRVLSEDELIALFG